MLEKSNTCVGTAEKGGKGLRVLEKEFRKLQNADEVWKEVIQ